MPHAVEAEVRLFDHLFSVLDVGNEEADYRSVLNPNSFMTLHGSRVELALQGAVAGQWFRFERQG